MPVLIIVLALGGNFRGGRCGGRLGGREEVLVFSGSESIVFLSFRDFNSLLNPVVRSALFPL